jgi:hypothetical protein
MKTTVQARLDDESQAALKQLTRRLGWSPSRVVREGLRLMVRHYGAAPKKRKIIGMGEFDSGIPDLGSNKKHLEGYGR